MSSKGVHVANATLRCAGLVFASVVLGGFFGAIAVSAAGLNYLVSVGAMMGCMVGLFGSPVLCWGLWRGPVLEGLLVVGVLTSVVAALAGWAAGLIDLAILAVLPTAVAYTGSSLWWGIQQRITARPIDTCVQCSYDLSGNESGVCPECGTEIAEPARFQPHSGQPEEKSPSRS